MGQGEVIEFLQKQKEPLSSGEIAYFMKEPPSKISRIISKLLEFSEIEYVEIDRKESMKRVGSRRRILLYYYPKSK